MKQGQLAEINDLLLDLRRQLLTTIDDVGGSAETVELDQAMVGRLSRMDAMQHQEMAKAQKRRAQIRLQRVEFCLQLTPPKTELPFRLTRRDHKLVRLQAFLHTYTSLEVTRQRALPAVGTRVRECDRSME